MCFNNRCLIVFLGVFFQTCISFAQVDSLAISNDSLENEKKHFFRMGLKSGNNILQNGQKMAKDEYYTSPSFSYWNNYGINTSISLTILPFQKRKLDNYYFTIGYEKDVKKYWTLALDYSYSHYFSSKQVQSSITHTVIFNISNYRRKIIPTFYIQGNYGSSIADYSFNLDFAYTYKKYSLFKTDDVLSFPNYLGCYAGTSNFYQNYTRNNQLTTSNGNKNYTVVTKFGITSVYLSSGIKYRFNWWAVALNCTYNIALNQPKIIINSNLLVYKLNMLLYF